MKRDYSQGNYSFYTAFGNQFHWILFQSGKI